MQEVIIAGIKCRRCRQIKLSGYCSPCHEFKMEKDNPPKAIGSMDLLNRYLAELESRRVRMTKKRVIAMLRNIRDCKV